jgi:hypothetical protein
MSTRRALQLCIAVGGLVPVIGGGWGVVQGLAEASAWTSSEERYLSGLLLAIGLAFWTTIPAIERKTARFRLLTLIVFVGGLCRLLGVLIGDGLSPSIGGALAMELGVTPLLCLWQARLDRR